QQDKPESKFYDDITRKIDNFDLTTTSYTEILRKEREFSTLWTQTLQFFAKIELDASSDQQNFFDGVRAIIQLKLDDKNEIIQQKKRRFINKNIELEPEKPKIVLKTQNNQNLDKKNKQILQQDNKFEQQLEKTKKYLLDIKQIQNRISSNLISQTESIEQIYRKSKNTHVNVKGTNKLLKTNKEKKRLLRRILFIWLLCLSFLMLFLHFSK
ncbi:SNARE protein Syntaxin 18/UFE1, partial [Pseudoloma neurophilia]